jgi:hypothetical protein
MTLYAGSSTTFVAVLGRPLESPEYYTGDIF